MPPEQTRPSVRKAALATLVAILIAKACVSAMHDKPRSRATEGSRYVR